MSTFPVREQLGSTLERYNLEIFKEPRGIIRILQLAFSIITIYMLRGYTGFITIDYCDKNNPSQVTLSFEYPFNLGEVTANVTCGNTSTPVSLTSDFSSEAEFLFTTSWVSAIFVIIIAFVYVKFKEEYETNGSLALMDFLVSVILAVLWIASFGGWGYGQSNLKKFTDPNFLTNMSICKNIDCFKIVRSSVTGITESWIFSFLNFFLWASGLWFLYKETPWYLRFQRAQ